MKKFGKNFQLGLQGGILAGSQAPKKSSDSHEIFAANHAVLAEFDLMVFLYILSNEGILPITHNMQEIFPGNRKKYLGTASNKLSQEEISCHWKKFLVTGRTILSLKEISCQRQKCPVTGRNFFALEEISCHRKKHAI